MADYRRKREPAAYGVPGQGRSLAERRHRAGVVRRLVGDHRRGLDRAALPAVSASGLLPSARSRRGGFWRCHPRSARLAFAPAALTAIPVGLMMGMSRIARGVFDPPLEFYRPIPPLAYLPLAVVWFGIGELTKVFVTKVFVIYLAIFAPMALNARAGVRSMALEQIQAAYSLGATRWQVIRHVILPGAMPEILTGMRIGLGFGWTTLVTAELVAAQAGLGAMIQQASDFLVSDVVVMGIVVIGAIAYLFDLAMRYLELKLTPWKGR